MATLSSQSPGDRIDSPARIHVEAPESAIETLDHGLGVVTLPEMLILLEKAHDKLWG